MATWTRKEVDKEISIRLRQDGVIEINGESCEGVAIWLWDGIGNMLRSKPETFDIFEKDNPGLSRRIGEAIKARQDKA